MAHAGELSFREAGACDLAIISPNDPGAMVQYAAECRALGIPYIYDPSQQVARMGGESCCGRRARQILICNDYEFEIIRQKTGSTRPRCWQHAEAVVVTKGEKGASMMLQDGSIDVPAVPPAQSSTHGRGRRVPRRPHEGPVHRRGLEVCGRLGSVAATYALEHMGGSATAYTVEEFVARYGRPSAR